VRSAVAEACGIGGEDYPLASTVSRNDAGAAPVDGSSANAGMDRPACASRQSIAHDPGGPPQRPHMGASDEPAPFGDAELTANTLSVRAVFGDPHCGHFTLASPLIVRTSCSNFPLHDWQVYS
jgi:hypothetical protein